MLIQFRYDEGIALIRKREKFLSSLFFSIERNNGGMKIL